MRRKYFKMLEREGEEVPQKKLSQDGSGFEQDQPSGSDDANIGDESGEDSDEEGDLFENSNEKNRVTTKEKKTKHTTQNKERAKKGVTHADRLNLIKDRKKHRKEELESKYKQMKEEREEKEQKRQKHRQQMNQFTKRGQPKMGPRINKLLDQIKDL